MTVTNKVILLVEDDAIVAATEAQQLQKEGYVIQHVCNGKDAIQVVKENPDKIDLILMDVNLGYGMDGTAAAQEILKEHDIPIIFLSSHTESEIVERTEKITSYGYVVKDSGITVLVASIKMAFKLYEAHKALDHSHSLMRYIIEHNRSSVAVHDKNLNYIYVSQRYLDEYKVLEKDVIGKHHYEVFPDLPEKWRQIHRRALAGEVSSADDDPYLRSDGSIDWTRWECRPWYEADGSVGGIIVYTEVINERKKIEEELRKSNESLSRELAEKQRAEAELLYANETLQSQAEELEVLAEELRSQTDELIIANQNLHDRDELLSSFLESTHESFLALDKNWRFIYVNRRFAERVGTTPNELLGKQIWNVLPKLMDSPIEKHYRQAMTNHQAVRFQATGVYSTAWLDFSIYPISNGIAVFAADRTEEHKIQIARKQTEEALEQALREKSTLLSDLQHRIKNSLNLITSVISLERDNHENSETVTALSDILGRVKSLTALYQSLFLTSDLHNIQMDLYLEQITQMLLTSLSAQRNIRLLRHYDHLCIDTRQATSLGLILNELLTNALKYAFPVGAVENNQSGEIRVSLTKVSDQLVLEVSDNGIGLPESFDIQKSSGLGLQIVQMLTMQMDGTLTAANSNGATIFRVTVPLNSVETND